MKSLSSFLDDCPNYIKDNFLNIKFNPLDHILLQNQTSNSVYIIKKGKAKVYSLTSNGVKYLEEIYNEYELFGEVEIFTDNPISCYVEALEYCEVIKISKDLFFEWLKYDSDFSLYITSQLSHKMYNACVKSKVNIVYPLKYRVLFFIWKFLDSNSLDALHKDMLVEGVGSNIRSVNRIIKELNDGDIIEYNNGFIKISDLNKLTDTINSYL